MATFRTANASQSSNTVTLSPTAGDTVIVFANYGTGGGTGTFSDNIGSGGGEPWVTTSVNGDTENGAKYAIGYLLNCPAGITTITATMVGGPGFNFLVAIAYQPAATASFIGITSANLQVTPGTGTNAIVSNALACGSVSALLVGLSTDTNGGSFQVAGTGFTVRTTSVNWAYLEDSNSNVTGSQTVKYTDATNGAVDTYLSYAIAFTDAAPTPPSNLTGRIGSFMGVMP